MLNIKNIGLVVLTLLFEANCSYAVQIPQSMRDSMGGSSVGMPSLLNLIVSMIVVIAMIYLTGFIYSKLNVINKSKLNSLCNDQKDMHRFTVLQSMTLGQQRHIYSIEMDGKIFLVGSTPNQISLIKEFEQNMDANTFTSEADLEIKSNLKENSNEEKTNKIDINELYKKYKS